MTDYKLISEYRDNKNYKEAFHIFISKVFPSISFRKWDELDYWVKNYIPFSFYDGEKIVANICVSLMDVFVNDVKMKAAQIGAVGTLNEFRKQGLSRKLMEIVLKKYSTETDFFFLFANESVLDFYPKFGFKPKLENLFIAENPAANESNDLKKLSLDNKDDLTLVKNLLEKRRPITKIFGADNYAFITIWHLLNIHYDNLFYSPKHKCLFVKTESEGKLHLHDIIGESEIDLTKILPELVESNDTKSILCYFPNDQIKYNYNKIESYDSNLFILGDINFDNKTIKFPETAGT